MRCSDQAGAARGAGEGAGWLVPSHQPSRRGAPCPARPGPALPSARPPPDRPGIPCGGMWLLAGPGGTQLAGGREGGARGAGGSERPGGTAGGGPLGGIPAPPAGGPRAGRGALGGRLVRAIAQGRLGPAARRAEGQVCETREQRTARPPGLPRRLSPAAARPAGPPERAPPPNLLATPCTPTPFHTCAA